jgi:hypothetical protein
MAAGSLAGAFIGALLLNVVSGALLLPPLAAPGRFSDEGMN